MKIVVDMNLPPAWCETLVRAGHGAVHWMNVGDHRAADEEILRWARQNHAVVFSHDLDFSALLATSRAGGPSVIQVRSEDVLPEAIGSVVSRAIKQFSSELESGALVVVEPWRMRCRVLPLSES